MRILVIGGTQFIGRHLVERLLEAGHDVTLLHRRHQSPFGPRVANAVADRNDAVSIRSALAGNRFDAAYDIAYDPQHGTTARQVEATARAVPGDLTRYVYMSSVAAYGEGLDHDEDDALAASTHRNPYVRNKAESERALFRLHREAGFPTVTFRPPFVYGPWNPMYREAFFWDRMRAGRPVILPGDGARLMQFVYVHDLVAACFAALESPAAPGRAYNIGNPPVTQIEAVAALAVAFGKPMEIVHVPRDVIQRNGGKIFTEPFYFGQYLDVPPITEHVARVQTELGIELTPFPTGLAKTFEWYAAQAPRRGLDFALEDRLIAEAAD